MRTTSRLTRLALSVTAAIYALGFASLGCQSGRVSEVGSLDAGVALPSAEGGGARPVSHGTLSDAGGGASVAPGTQLVRSPTVLANGVTDDGYAIYTDLNLNTVNAVALDGGAPIVLGYIDVYDDVFVQHDTVFFSAGLGALGVGTLSMWRSGFDQTDFVSAAAAPFADYMATTDDGESLFYYDDIDPNARGNLVVHRAHETGKTVLLESVELGNPSCAPQIAFMGSRVVVAYCSGPTDTPASATVTSFVSPSWSEEPVATAVLPWFATDARGTEVMVSGPNGLEVYPLGGAPDAGTVIDVAGMSGVFVSDASAVVYTTSDSALERSPVEAPSPAALVTGLAQMIGLSPDEKWVVGARGANGTTGATDLYFASTTASSIAFPLVSTTTGTAGGFYGDVFTDDSAYAIYFANVGSVTGTLSVAPIGFSERPGVPIASNVFAAFATHGSRIVFNGAYDETGGTADIVSVDSASPREMSVLVSGADAPFYIDSARRQIVYSRSAAMGESAGIWGMAAP